MRSSAAVFASLPRLIIGSLLPWYLWEEPRYVLKMYVAYAKAFLEIISFKFLILSLISPWKGIMDAYPSKGFNFSQIAQTFALNMTARGIGMIVRLITIVLGIALQVALFVGFAVYLIIWYAFIFVVIAGVAYVIVP